MSVERQGYRTRRDYRNARKGSVPAGIPVLAIDYWPLLRQSAAAVLRLPGQVVQGDVQREHVYPGLAQELDVAGLGVLGHQLLDLGHRQVPGRRHPVNLDGRVLRRDVGVETRSGRGDGVRRDRGNRHVIERQDLRLELLDVGDQGRVVRAEVGRGRVAGVAAVVGG